jgi:hypothetical protein
MLTVFISLLSLLMMSVSGDKSLNSDKHLPQPDTKNGTENKTSCISDDVKKKVLRYFSGNKNATVDDVIKHFGKKEIGLDVEIVSALLKRAKSVQHVSKNLDLKYKVVKFAQKNLAMTNAEIGKMFSSINLEVTEHNVKDWKRNKESIIKAKEEGMKGNMGKIKHSLNPKLELVLKNWFFNMRKNLPKVPIDGAVLKTKSETLAKLMGMPAGFSVRQIESFCDRYNIHSKFMYGSKLSVDVNRARRWLEQNVPGLIEEFGVENIFNADEAAFFYQALPNRTLALDVEDVAGAGKGKSRFTFHACMSMAGERLQLLVIGFFPLAFSFSPFSHSLFFFLPFFFFFFPFTFSLSTFFSFSTFSLLFLFSFFLLSSSFPFPLLLFFFFPFHFLLFPLCCCCLQHRCCCCIYYNCFIVFIRQSRKPNFLLCWKTEKKYSSYVGSFGQRVDDNYNIQQVGNECQQTDGVTG